MINIPSLKIRDLEVSLIQGGMGLGVSVVNLVSAVAEQGGAGIIASVGLGLLRGHFSEEMAKRKNELLTLKGSQRRALQNHIYAKANSAALADEIRHARKKSNGIIGVNILHALNDYPSLVRTSVKENVDLIIVGAGIPKDLPKYLGDKNIKLLPIVSSARVANFICKAWKKYNKIPDAIIVEGPLAGGHLGFSLDDLTNSRVDSLEKIVKDVIEAVDNKIPVIGAGGIDSGKDIYRFHKLGAAGVQMASKFVTTFGCDGSEGFKQTYINAKKEDIILINSPLGMPGRVIKNDFTEKIKSEKINFKCKYDCLKGCNPAKSPYCIIEALIQAQKGNLKDGFAFAGAKAYLAKEIVSVEDVFKNLEREYNSC
jgi:NAD(P)H-dependent flavin oxidoreductase YrpB (nitropropane dioxygenase family)